MNPYHAKPWRSRRWAHWDYTSPGEYFVTICTREKKHFFGSVAGMETHLSPTGRVVQEVWQSVPAHFPHARLDSFTIMPNHVHGILIFDRQGPSLGTVIGRFKGEVSRRVQARIWQRYFYDHVIRSKASLDRIRIYIGRNPMYWPWDSEYPQSARFIDR